MMRGLKCFYGTTVENIRRDLIPYGVGVSNLAERTRKDWVEISTSAVYLYDYIKQHTPAARESIEIP